MDNFFLWIARRILKNIFSKFLQIFTYRKSHPGKPNVVEVDRMLSGCMRPMLLSKAVTTNGVAWLRYHLDILVSDGASPVSSVFSNRKRPAASRILLNSIQNACTSMNKSCTLIILLRIKDWRKTHTRRTKRFWKRKKFQCDQFPSRYLGNGQKFLLPTCMYLSLICSQVEMQLDI